MVRRRLRWRDAIASLVIGAVATVLVAWSLALQVRPHEVSSVAGAPWPAEVPSDWPGASQYTQGFQALWGPGGLRQWWAWGEHPAAAVTPLLDMGASTRRRGAVYHLFVSQAGWPMVSMQSVLRKRADSGYWAAEREMYENEGTIEAGLVAPLHWSEPHVEGPSGWCSRRVPLRPLPLGFAVNTAAAALIVQCLFTCWRWRSRSVDRAKGRRLSLALRGAAVLCLGWALNITVAFALWLHWQFGAAPLELPHGGSRYPGSSAQGATVLPGLLAAWPAAVPPSWPDQPVWIGYMGAARGVRAYEFTTNGVPGEALMWIHVTWSFGAFDPHQKMLVTQVGWPLPCLQSEELFEVAGRDAPSQPDDGSPEAGFATAFPAFEPLERRGVLSNVVLPGSPQATSQSEPTPYLPLRPVALGMVANTLLYSVIVGFLLLAPGAVRAWRRHRLGLCLNCGYDIKELAACPECGVVREGASLPRPA